MGIEFETGNSLIDKLKRSNLIKKAFGKGKIAGKTLNVRQKEDEKE